MDTWAWPSSTWACHHPHGHAIIRRIPTIAFQCDARIGRGDEGTREAVLTFQRRNHSLRFRSAPSILRGVAAPQTELAPSLDLPPVLPPGIPL